MPDTTTQSTSGLLTLGTSSPSALTTASINKETVQVRTSSKAN